MARILLTGITGVIGSELAEHLVFQGHIIIALGRGKDEQSFAERTSALASENISTIEGDITEELCGISQDDLLRLTGKVDAVFHCAADIHFEGESVEKVNVGGTRNLLDVAEALGVRHVHAVSTAYVCGEAVTFKENELLSGRPRNTYERSKRNAEIETQKFHARTGTPVSIYRIPIVVGNSKTGRIKNPGTGYYGFFMPFYFIRNTIRQLWQDDEKREGLRECSIEVGEDGAITFPIAIPCSSYPLNIVPIDWVVKMMTDLFEYIPPSGIITYNITNPAYNAPPVDYVIGQSLEILGFRPINDIPGFSLGNVEPQELSGYAKAFQKKLRTVIKIFDPYIKKGAEIFSSTETKKALAYLGARWQDPPPFDEKLFRILLKYAEDNKFRAE